MSAPEVYHQVRQLFQDHFDPQVDESSRERMALFVMGMIQAESGSPAKVASGIEQLGLTGAQAESLERQIRRMENDAEISAEFCFHPLARRRLLLGRPKRLLLILDPTLQEDRVVMVSAAVWYRGRALPLVWALWPANTPLEGAGFWQRIAGLLDQVAKLLPAGVEVIWLADRAFGTPAFTDLVLQHGWHFLVRAQGQTHYQDCLGKEASLQSLVKPGRRAKLSGKVFKKSGWRRASVLAYWGKSYKSPLCLVSDLPPDWSWLALYRRRYPIEASFRDYKSYGWRWEQGQVRHLEHLERLLVGMALATWIALFVGTARAEQILQKPATGKRRTPPWLAKRSLFRLGLQTLDSWLFSDQPVVLPRVLSDWEAPNWQDQLTAYHAHAFIFA